LKLIISNHVKSAFKVEKLHPISRIREFVTHGSHGIQEKRKKINLDQERRSKNLPMSDDPSLT